MLPSQLKKLSRPLSAQKLSAENRLLRFQLATSQGDLNEAKLLLAAVLRLVEQLATCPPNQPILQRALQSITQEVSAQAAALHIWSPQEHCFRLSAYHNLSEALQQAWEQLFVDPLHEPIVLPLSNGFQEVHPVPIYAGSEIIGLLTACWEQVGQSGRYEQEFLKQAAMLLSLLIRGEEQRMFPAASNDLTPDAFVSMLSHDLQAPLSLIIGYAEVLLEGYFGPLAEEQAEQIRTIQASAQRAADLITQLSDIFKLSQGQHTLELAPYAIDQLLQEAIEKLQSFLKDRQQHIEISVEGTPPPIAIDGERIKEALTLLLHYIARRAPTQSTLHVKISVASRQDEEKLVLTIALEPQATLQGPYQKTEQRSKSLSLFIAQTMIQLHGGQVIWLDPQHDGELVRVELPITHAS